MSQQQAGADPSKEFFRKLRAAAENEDIAAIDEVMGEAGGAYAEIWRANVTAGELKKSICSNLAAIIKICDSIISDPKASAKDVAWAKDKKKTSQESQKKQGCESQPVALETSGGESSTSPDQTSA